MGHHSNARQQYDGEINVVHPYDGKPHRRTNDLQLHMTTWLAMGKGPRGCHTHRVSLPAEEPRPWGTQISSAEQKACLTSILEGGSVSHGAEYNLSFAQRETPCLTTKEAICSTNIPEKTGRVSACKACGNRRDPQRTVSHQ